MSDAEGIRNLVGTGLVQLVGGIVTAVLGLGVLLYLNWRLTIVTMVVLALFGGGMAYAFRNLRPLFRERGKINAEVTGRLTEALGGIRVVKSYTAEKREEIVFAKGAHRLFRNIAKSMTGVSATTSGSTVIIGVVGVVMIWLGGRDILAGRMTLGDFIMYIFFIGLVAAPLVVDRVDRHADHRGVCRPRSHPRDPRHGDRRRRGRGEGGRSAGMHGDIAFDDVWFEYHEGEPVLKGVSFEAPAGHDDGAGRIERVGQEHADQPGDGVQPAAARAAFSSTGATSATIPLRDYREQLASVLQENFLFDGTIAENIGYSRSSARRSRRSRRRAASRTARSSSCGSPTATTRSWASAASSCRAGSGSACRSRARFSPTRAC